MAWIAAIASALIGAGSAAKSSSDASMASAASDAAQRQKGAGGDKGFESSAEKFAPGISGTGDGSMPVKADKPGEIFSQKPDLAPVSSQQAPMPAEATAPAATPPPQAPQTTQPNPPPNTNDYASWAQTGLQLGQAIKGQPPPPAPVAQVGGQGYQPTALQMLQMMAEKKRQMGY